MLYKKKEFVKCTSMNLFPRYVNNMKQSLVGIELET